MVFWVVSMAGCVLDGYSGGGKCGGSKLGPTPEPSLRKKDSNLIKLMCVGGRREGGSREPE